MLASNPLTVAFAPIALAQVPITIASGALAAATVAAQTIPQFDKGTKNTPDTYIAGEKGTEIRVGKDGQMSLINEPTLFTNDAGAEIISRRDTAQIMTDQGRKFISDNYNSNPQMAYVNAQILNELGEIRKATKKQKPVKIFNSPSIDSRVQIGNASLQRKLKGN